jgi:phage FluMu protein Com
MGRYARRNVLQLVEMSCRHTKEFEDMPKIGSEHYCIKCNKSVTAVGRLQYYKVKCLSCKWAQNYGMAKVTAGVKANTHAIRKHHIVSIIDSEGWEEIIGEDPSQLTLDV